MNDCVLSPRPAGSRHRVRGPVRRGMRFCAEYGDYNFNFNPGVNDRRTYREPTQRLAEAAEKTGRDVGSLPLSWRSWRYRRGGPGQVGVNTTPARTRQRWAICPTRAPRTSRRTARGTARTINLRKARSTSTWPLWSVRMRRSPDRSTVAAMPGVKGMMLTFDDFVTGVHDFGTK